MKRIVLTKKAAIQKVNKELKEANESVAELILLRDSLVPLLCKKITLRDTKYLPEGYKMVRDKNGIYLIEGGITRYQISQPSGQYVDYFSHNIDALVERIAKFESFIQNDTKINECVEFSKMNIKMIELNNHTAKEADKLKEDSAIPVFLIPSVISLA